MHDVECPYCGEGQFICHDDGYGYTEGPIHEQECGDCGKTFAYTTSVLYLYEAHQAPCMNGGEHDLEPVVHAPERFPDWKRCKNCDHQQLGKRSEASST